MKLQVLGSSSKGNCYLLTANDGSTLIIEAGITFLEIKRALAFNLSRIVGCVVSHRHGDHAKGLADMARAGVTVHCSLNVINSQDLDVQPLLVETSRRQWMLVGGEFEVLTLEAFHDVPCESFVIRHPGMGKLLFLTDSVSFPYKIQGLDHVLIEANYSDKVLEENILTGKVPSSMRSRLLTSHMEIATTLHTIRKQDLSKVKEIVLLHLSDNNSDPKEFKRLVESKTGIATYLAQPGLEITLEA